MISAFDEGLPRARRGESAESLDAVQLGISETVGRGHRRLLPGAESVDDRACLAKCDGASTLQADPRVRAVRRRRALDPARGARHRPSSAWCASARAPPSRPTRAGGDAEGRRRRSTVTTRAPRHAARSAQRRGCVAAPWDLATRAYLRPCVRDWTMKILHPIPDLHGQRRPSESASCCSASSGSLSSIPGRSAIRSTRASRRCPSTRSPRSAGSSPHRVREREGSRQAGRPTRSALRAHSRSASARSWTTRAGSASRQLAK